MIIVAIDETTFERASEIIEALDSKKYGKDWKCCFQCNKS